MIAHPNSRARMIDEVDPRLKAATFVRYGGMVVVHHDTTYYVLTSPGVKQALAWGTW